MKLLCILPLFFFTGSIAQSVDSSSNLKPRPGSARLQLADGSIARGWFYSASDSQVVLLRASNKELKQPESNWSSRLTSYPIANIQSIAVKRKNAGRRGALIGLGVGVLTGAIIGFASGDDEIATASSNDPFGSFAASIHNAFAMTAGEKALVGAAVLGTGGAITGAVIGSVARKKFIIKGRAERYRERQHELQRRLIFSR